MAKRYIAPLVGGRVRLRLLDEADLPMTLAWRNQDHIRKWFFYSHVITPDQHRRWFEQYRHRDDDFVFVIEEHDTLMRPVGQVSLYNIDWAGRRGEFGRLLIGDPAAAGLGIAAAATRLLVDEALSAWGLAEVGLEVLQSNAPALAIYRRYGFIETGRQGDTIAMRARAATELT